MQIHRFQIDPQGKIARPNQPNIRTLKEAKAEDDGDQAYQRLTDTLASIADHVNLVVSMDGSKQAVYEGQDAPEYPKAPGFLKKLVDSQANSKYAAAQQSCQEYLVGGRDRAAEAGVVVTSRADNRFGMEAEARFDPSMPTGFKLTGKRGVLLQGLESLNANFFVTESRKNDCLESGYGSLIAGEHLEFQKTGDIESYSYTTREYRNSEFVAGWGAGELVPSSSPAKYSIVVNRKDGTLTFEHP